MLGIRKLRLFSQGVEPFPTDCVVGDDGHVLTEEEVERIARSLIEDAPLDDHQRRGEAAVAALYQPGPAANFRSK